MMQITHLLTRQQAAYRFSSQSPYYETRLLSPYYR